MRVFMTAAMLVVFVSGGNFLEAGHVYLFLC
jgi:hypothetical protein